MRYKARPDARTRRRSARSVSMWGVRHGSRSNTYKTRQGRLLGN